ncbi:serine/threonine protein kinase [Thermobifida halotolerans]|uniref:Serine/threonine protein kinase n=1 Tax=Thermobifida halotolerans TaxID=483545 RepID=A0AA97LTU5_9ACTN|nr:serine/threonine-protein kinase [Thermobifida halotolerans]UOE17938.1 serine/threonine protein kinase [Thermobifida halotolerans]
MTPNGHERARPLRTGDPTELGGYRIVGRLGRGGMGTVYLGRSAEGRTVAIKLIHPDLSDDTAFRRRFAREVAAARRVARFSTAAVIDARLDGDPLFIVSEYVAGPNLAEAVKTGGPMHGGTLESLAMGVAAALTAIHGAGVVHRDLKPANVLLSSVGPKVIDFGIARAMDDDSAVTRSSQLMGTPAYLAPELIAGEPPATPSDIFSWGCLVAYAGTGRAPFDGPTVPAVLHQIISEPPNLSGLDPAMRELVESALGKFPDNRPTAQELLNRLIGQEAPSPDAVHETVARSWTPPSVARPAPESTPSGPNPAAHAVAAPPAGTPPTGQPAAAAPPPGQLPGPPGTPPTGQPAAAPPVPGGTGTAAHVPGTPPGGQRRPGDNALPESPAPWGGPGQDTPRLRRRRRLHPGKAVGAGATALALVAAAVLGGVWLFGGPGVPQGIQIYADDFTTRDGWDDRDFDPENTFYRWGYHQGGYALSADGDSQPATGYPAPVDDLPEQVRISATARVLSGPAYGTFGLYCFRNDDGDDNTTAYTASVRVDGTEAEIRRDGGPQGSTHLERVTGDPLPGFAGTPGDAEEPAVNTLDFTCELDAETDTIGLNLWINGEHVLEAVDGNPLPHDGEGAPQTGITAARGVGGGGDIVVVFDDFAVYRLGDGETGDPEG